MEIGLSEFAKHKTSFDHSHERSKILFFESKDGKRRGEGAKTMNQKTGV